MASRPDQSEAHHGGSVPVLIASYPRPRPPLPPAHTKIYVEEYKINRGESDRLLYRLTSTLESWMHRRISAYGEGNRLLELGAGTLNHLPYEDVSLQYDIVEPLPALYANSPDLARIGQVYETISDVPAGTNYDRIVSVAVLEHLEDLPALVANSGLLLAPGGIFQAGIPAEGGFLWGLSWRLSTAISYRLRTGLPYAPVMRHEHVNSAHEIIAILQWFFRDVRVDWFPLPLLHFSFYAYLEAQAPDLERCAAFLAGRARSQDEIITLTTRSWK